MGWKMILGSVLLGVGQAIKAMPEPLHAIGTVVEAIGTALLGIGAAHKLVKIETKLGGK